MTKRPSISDGMKYRALKLHQRVMVQCLDCVAWRDWMKKALGEAPDEQTMPTWHPLDAVQFDHVHELADGGKHGAKHLRPKCTPHHRKKSATQLKHRKHLDRAGKKHRGEWKSKKPMGQSRGFDKTLSKKFSGEVVKR